MVEEKSMTVDMDGYNKAKEQAQVFFFRNKDFINKGLFINVNVFRL